MAIDPSDIEDCHWLKSKGPKKVITKFARHKDANLIRKNKNKLNRMNLCSVCINNPVLVNDSHCSYYKMLWRKCKKLWSSKYIHTFWVSNSTLRLKLTENGCVHIITHSQDLWTSEGRTIGPSFCLSCLFSLEFMVFYIHFTVLVFLASYL